MASIWNNQISISVFGESQGTATGITIDNLPPGEYIDFYQISRFMERHSLDDQGRPVLNQVISGILNDRTTGSPLCVFIQNPTPYRQNPSPINRLPRPGHADYTGTLRYKGFNDIRDGGSIAHSMTASLCFAGAVCGQILERRGIYIGAHIEEMHGIHDKSFNHISVSKEEILDVRYRKFPVISPVQGEKMLMDIQAAAEGGETLGGAVECVAINVPAGIGSPLFNGLENTIAQLLFSLPDIRGLEFGAGFDVTKMTGSQCNDSYYVDKHGHIRTASNSHGGILGGISSGMPIVLKAAFRPPASIGIAQESVNLSTLESVTLPPDSSPQSCNLPKLVPCVESAVNIALLSHMLDYPHFC